MYHMDISLDTDLFHDWITGAETKVVCRTELEKESPEGTLTCIGFRPMEAEEIKKYKGYFCPNCGEKKFSLSSFFRY